MLKGTFGSANLHRISRFAPTSGRMIFLCHAELMETPWRNARLGLDLVDTQITELNTIKKKKNFTFCANTRNAPLTDCSCPHA